MSFYYPTSTHHNLHNHGLDQSFGPFFRFLDDFDSYRGGRGGRAARSQPSFQPKFDVHEADNSYTLEGELPGVAREDVHIKFVDATTLQVSGRVERRRTEGTPPAGLVDAAGSITEAGEGDSTPHRQATVEDESVAANTPSTTAAGTTAGEANTANAEIEQVPRNTGNNTGAKYWVSERSVGQFSRNFNFPQLVDQEGVKASLNNGVLTVVIPKAKKHESRRIDVE